MSSFIPLEQRVQVCVLASRYCTGNVHAHLVKSLKDKEETEQLLCRFHGRLWPRVGASKADIIKLAKRRRANQEAQGFQPATGGRSFGAGTGWKGHTLEV